MDEPFRTEPPSPAPVHKLRWWHHLVALFFAIVGGFLGILGAIVNELRTGGFILLPIIGAPMIEEALKPSGIYILLAKWPWMLRGQLYTAVLTAISGLCFGLIEALVYVYIYVDDAPAWFATYRFTLPVLMHTVCSFIMGLGINEGITDWARDGAPFPGRSRNLYITAVTIHGIFNAVAITLALSGVFPDVD